MVLSPSLKLSNFDIYSHKTSLSFSFFSKKNPLPRSRRSWFILLKRYIFLFFWKPKIVRWSVKSISFSPCSPFHFLSWNNYGGFHKDPKLWFKIWSEIIFCVVWCFHSVACLLGMESTLLGPTISSFVLPFSKSYLLGFCRYEKLYLALISMIGIILDLEIFVSALIMWKSCLCEVVWVLETFREPLIWRKKY